MRVGGSKCDTREKMKDVTQVASNIINPWANKERSSISSLRPFQKRNKNKYDPVPIMNKRTNKSTVTIDMP